MNYPNPDQLREWANEPMPFHHFTPTDLELVNTTLRVGIENTEYRYRLDGVRIETRSGVWISEDDFCGVELGVKEAFQDADDIRIEEDFIEAVGAVKVENEGTAMYQAMWVLRTVTVRNE